MPIFEYQCKDCGKVIEIFHQRAGEDSLPVCSSCGSTNLIKLLSAPGMVKTGDASSPGTTCCGRTERCDTPPCSEEGVCRRDRE
jgi:putative FmdB family regulatory protein